MSVRTGSRGDSRLGRDSADGGVFGIRSWFGQEVCVLVPRLTMPMTHKIAACSHNRLLLVVLECAPLGRGSSCRVTRKLPNQDGCACCLLACWNYNCPLEQSRNDST